LLLVLPQLKKVMKLQILTLALAISALSATAQTKRRSNTDLSGLNPLTRSILKKQSTTNLNKGSGIEDRLMGYSYHADNFLEDSARFVYSNGRGSKLNNNFFGETYLQVDYDPTIPLVNRSTSFDRERLALSFDTAYLLYATSPTNYSYSVITRQYSGNTINQYIDGIHVSPNRSFYNKRKHEFTYNTNNMLEKAHLYIDTAAVPAGSFVDFGGLGCKYLGNKIVLDSNLSTSNHSFRVEYAYDALGNLIQVLDTSSTFSLYRNTMTYNSNNQLTMNLFQMGNGIDWIDISVDSIRYHSNNPVYSSHFKWNDNLKEWEDGIAYVSHFDASNNMDTSNYYLITNSGLTPFAMTVASYTAYNHLKTHKLYYHNGTSFSTAPDSYWQFYYETYTTSVNPVTQKTDLAIAYPIPATSILNIQMKIQPTKPLQIHIFNDLGQLLQTSINTPAASYTIPVHQLKQGNYFVEISNETGKQIIPFVKQ
jgi:YD repeat-containing protein